MGLSALLGNKRPARATREAAARREDEMASLQLWFSSAEARLGSFTSPRKSRQSFIVASGVFMWLSSQSIFPQGRRKICIRWLELIRLIYIEHWFTTLAATNYHALHAKVKWISYFSDDIFLYCSKLSIIRLSQISLFVISLSKTSFPTDRYGHASFWRALKLLLMQKRDVEALIITDIIETLGARSLCSSRYASSH